MFLSIIHPHSTAAAISQPGALPATLAWYRALIRFGAGRYSTPEARVSVPTVILWGVQDNALTLPVMLATAELCDQVRTMQIRKGSHWIVQEVRFLSRVLTRSF